MLDELRIPDNILLNEGFATFAATYWGEHQGDTDTYTALKQQWATTPASSSFWNQAVAAPGRDGMFSSAVYQRGGMTLAVLRHTIGDAAFFTLLQTWTDQHRYGNATTAQFIALATQISGKNLTSLFQTWLYTKTRPATF